MAIAALWQAERFNRPSFELFEHDVYALVGDGCMMEGVASEAASLALGAARAHSDQHKRRHTSCSLE